MAGIEWDSGEVLQFGNSTVPIARHVQTAEPDALLLNLATLKNKFISGGDSHRSPTHVLLEWPEGQNRPEPLPHTIRWDTHSRCCCFGDSPSRRIRAGRSTEHWLMFPNGDIRESEYIQCWERFGELARQAGQLLAEAYFSLYEKNRLISPSLHGVFRHLFDPNEINRWMLALHELLAPARYPWTWFQNSDDSPCEYTFPVVAHLGRPAPFAVPDHEYSVLKDAYLSSALAIDHILDGLNHPLQPTQTSPTGEDGRADSSADNQNNSQKKLPENPHVLSLCQMLGRELNSGNSEIQIARDFREGLSEDAQSAKDLLRQARRFKHLWKPPF